MPGINWLGNTRAVAKTKVESLPDFPELKQRKAGRVITKHFANLTYTLQPKYISLLSFLIYQAAADNTIQYTSTLNESYNKAVQAAQAGREGCPEINCSKPTFRNQINYLIKTGLLLPTNHEAKYLINPNLTYNRGFVTKQYFDYYITEYNKARRLPIREGEAHLREINESFIIHVSAQLAEKHKSAELIQ